VKTWSWRASRSEQKRKKIKKEKKNRNKEKQTKQYNKIDTKKIIVKGKKKLAYTQGDLNSLSCIPGLHHGFVWRKQF
jgi:hypothetical protein